MITGPPFLKHSIYSRIRQQASYLLAKDPLTDIMHSYNSRSDYLSESIFIVAPPAFAANSLIIHPSINY